jgi:hypothetical protein
MAHLEVVSVSPSENQNRRSTLCRLNGDVNRVASPHAKSLFEFARKVMTRAEEMRSSAGEGVIQIQ